MLEPVGFWSYARQDEQQTGGRLSQLRAIVGKAIGCNTATRSRFGRT